MTSKTSVDKLYAHLIERFVKWAETREDIRAAIVVGSRARTEFPADEWSDLDMIVITSNPQHYISTTEWIENIGKPLLTFVEPTAGSGDDTERRVLFEGMVDVDFALIPLQKAQQLLQNKTSPGVAALVSNVFGRGMRIILDKGHMAEDLQSLIDSVKYNAVMLPTKQEFLQVVNDFLYHAVFTAKHLRRGELWWSIMCADCHMQNLLLQMIEWHAQATHEPGYDTWFRGRFLEKWADPKVLNELQGTFAHYDVPDVRRALLASTRLFRKIATETANKLNYSYPNDADGRVTEWVKTCLSTKN